MFREFPRPQRFRVKKGLTAEQGHEADCRQPTLRSGSRQRLMPSVDMTSDVKSWEQLFYVGIHVLSSVHRKRRSQ